MNANSLEQVKTLERLSAGMTHALGCENPEVLREMVRTLNDEMSAVVGGILYAVENGQPDGAAS